MVSSFFRQHLRVRSRTGAAAHVVLGLVWGLCATLPANAGRTYLGIQNGVVIDADFSSVSTTGKMRRIWISQNYPTPTIHGAKSLLIQLEIDCVKDQIRRAQLLAFAGEQESGTLLYSNAEPGPWEHIEYGTIHKHLQYVTCLKKANSPAPK